MQRIHSMIVCLIVHLAASVGVLAVDPASIAVVRAKVTSVQAEGDGKVGTAVLEIVHVYAGTPALKGQTFLDSYRLVDDFQGRAARSAFKVDEQGLWTLKEGAKGVLVPVTDASLPFRIRSRNTNQSPYAEHVKLAEVIELLATTKENERVKKLTELANDESADIATWAVWAISASKDAEAERYLDSFAEKPDVKMPLRAQVVMDEILSKAKREDWFRAKTRLPMLKAWVTAKVDDNDTYRILNRIDHADDWQELRNEVACELVSLAVGNPDWSVKSRKYAITVLGRLGKKVVDDSAAFDRLLEVVRKNKEKELRESAAVAILKYIRLDDKRRAAVNEAQAKDK